MFKSGLAAAAIATLGLFAGEADAASISFGPVSSNSRAPVFTFSNLVAPTSITGDATLSFTVRGDLDYYGEYIDVTLDGLYLGRVLDNNTSNDRFDVPRDIGNQSRSNITATATLTNAELAPLIADGFLDLTFRFSRYVDCCGSVNTLFGNLSYDSTVTTSNNDTGPSPVPLPAGLPLMAVGLAAFGVAARRKKQA